jgi:serum/glucocorticoid-regulated kinase 2
MLSVIGKGSYAKVILVRKKEDGKLYAIKSMKKKYI